MTSPASRMFVHPHALTRALARAFPTPLFLLPPTVGIDISDTSAKWLALDSTGESRRVRTFGEIALTEGVVVGGIIKDPAALGDALRQLKQHVGGIEYVHAALPEEAVYVFSMHVPPRSRREQILQIIEFELEGRVPIPPSAAVYDYNIIEEHEGDAGVEIAVAVFPRDLAESYAAAFERAGFILMSLELEARSIARAITSPAPNEPITLLVDFGRARTGFAVLKRGIPIFTSTAEVGGNAVTRAVMQTLSLNEKKVEEFKNVSGLDTTAGSKRTGIEAVIGAASALADEVARYYHYWDTRRDDKGNRVTPVGRVVLVGGSSNLRGLPDYIAGRIQAPVEIGNVWHNICSFDDYIPPIDARTSLQYATCVGLALRGM